MARLGVGLVAIMVGAMACRPGDPEEPKTPVNVPLPTKLDRPDDPPGKPPSPPDASAAMPSAPAPTVAGN